MTESENKGFGGQENSPRQTSSVQHDEYLRFSGQQAYNESQTQSGQNTPKNLSISQEGTPPNNYMVISIVATVLGVLCFWSNCCISMVIGIVAIIFSLQSSSKYTLGDANGAENSANTAKILGITSLVLIGVSLVATIIGFIMMLGDIGGWKDYIEGIKEAVEEAQYY